MQTSEAEGKSTTIPFTPYLPAGQYITTQHNYIGQIRSDKVGTSDKLAKDAEVTQGSEAYHSDGNRVWIKLLPIAQFNQNVESSSLTFQQQQEQQMLPRESSTLVQHVTRMQRLLVSKVNLQEDAEQLECKDSTSQVKEAFARICAPYVRWSDVDTTTRSIILERFKRLALFEAIVEGKIRFEQVVSIPLDWQSIALEMYENRGLIHLPVDFDRTSSLNPLCQQPTGGSMGRPLQLDVSPMFSFIDLPDVILPPSSMRDDSK